MRQSWSGDSERDPRGKLKGKCSDYNSVLFQFLIEGGTILMTLRACVYMHEHRQALTMIIKYVFFLFDKMLYVF